MARARRRADAGFTLVEMLVSLAIMALAAALMVEGLRSSRMLWAGEAARTARGETVEAAQAILRARIERLRPATRFTGDLTFADIDGDDRQLTFLSQPSDADQPAGARRFRLALDARGELVLTVTALQRDANELEGGQLDGGAGAVYSEQVLLRDVGGLDISYYGPDPKGGSPQWRSDWTQRAEPPQAVRIKLRLKDGDVRFWPELVVHPAAVVDTLCTIDPATGACRGRA